jgi:tryptophan synthase alpha chain
MSKIKNAFHADKKSLIIFLVAGDPTIDKTIEFVLAAEKAGADLIEIGIPFSDPIAEGPVIQEANERALSKGIKIAQIFDMVKRIREKTNIPIVFLTYINPIFNFGAEKFTAMCNETGIDGLIIPDLPFEERDEIYPQCQANGLDLITLIAPTSEPRLEKIIGGAAGFVYCVSSRGVTGMRKTFETDLAAMTTAVKSCTKTPLALGFGISSPEQLVSIRDLADGFIVGSAIVKLIGEHGENATEKVHDFVKSLKAVL